MKPKSSKNIRVLDIYARLCEGKSVNKAEDAKKFGVDARTIVKELISNEQFHYVELGHKTYIQDKLWHIGTDIKEHNLIEIKYSRGEHTGVVTGIIEPMAILFSEYYFYLNAFIVKPDKDGKYVHKYDYPAIFRIDRIKEYKELREKFQVSYADRFEEGEFRKRIQFMYSGHLMKIQLKFYGENPEPVLDRLPTARIVEEKEHQISNPHFKWGSNFNPSGVFLWFRQRRDFAVPFLLVAS